VTRAPSRVGAAVVALLAVAVAAGSGTAQERPADSMNFMRERVLEDRKRFIASNLELTESEARAFWPVYDRFQSEMLNVQERALRVVGDYTTAYPNLSDDLARRLLDESLAVDADWSKVRQAFVPQFRAALPEKKVVRYYQIENKLHALVMYELATRIPIVK
jgi:hypothetical protein